MRVIGGLYGGRRLQAPPGSRTRPTSDRVREALFSSLAAQIPGARVLDLYAGSGALGIEALSRGASSAVFVERDRRAAGVLRRNLVTLGLDAPVVVSDVATFAERWEAGSPFDVVFVDPPYAEPLPRVISALHLLWQSAALRPGARVVVERDRRDDAIALDRTSWVELERRRSYGDTVLLHLQATRPPIGEDGRDTAERSAHP